MLSFHHDSGLEARKPGVLAVRGDRLMVAYVENTYQDGSSREYLILATADEAASRIARMMTCDVGDLDAALGELDALHTALADT